MLAQLGYCKFPHLRMESGMLVGVVPISKHLPNSVALFLNVARRGDCNCHTFRHSLESYCLTEGPLSILQLHPDPNVATEAKKWQADNPGAHGQPSLTTALFRNIEIHSLAAIRSSFDPPFNTSFPSRYLINRASPHEARTSPSSLNGG